MMCSFPVLMPMMDIREMRMGMLGSCVFMRVDMAIARLGSGMPMGVVTVIVPVPVFMFSGTMGMKMRMPSDEEHQQRDHKQARRHQLDRSDLISQHQDGQAHPKKRRR